MKHLLADEDQSFLAGGGEMGELIRSLDWSRTAIGPVASWPQSLRTTVSLILSARFPLLLWWGPQLVMIYNDAYRPILGSSKHPRAVGGTALEIWPEIWGVIGPMLDGVMQKGEATMISEGLLCIDRYGYLEECYFDYGYSAIKVESGATGGVICAVVEKTDQVIDSRRLVTLRNLGTRLGSPHSWESLWKAVADAIAANPSDLPYALIYHFDAAGDAHLVCRVGYASGDSAPDLIRASEPFPVWPVFGVKRQKGTLHLDRLTEQFSDLPHPVWPEPGAQALLLPLGSGEVAEGVLIAGISPRRRCDRKYQDFLELIAGQISSSLAAIRAFEEEKARAEALLQLNLAKTAFFSNVSHEFRTPLTLMLGPLESLIAQGELLSAEQREWLAQAHRNAQRQLRLVNTLLDFSRLEAGRLQARFAPLELGGYTAQLAGTFRSAMEQAGLRFSVQAPPLSEQVYVDPALWERIVFNLLSNALKFTLRGAVSVWVSEDQEQAFLAVEDSGCGIPESELPKLFTRFHRIDGAVGRSFEGSGIGLAMVQELVKLHGGSINVTSEPGEGSRFVVAVPKGRAHLPAGQIAEAAPVWDESAGALYLSEASQWNQATAPAPAVNAIVAENAVRADKLGRVLVADDNADLRAFVRSVLEPRFEVELAADGVQALALLRLQRPDLLLSDVMMPNLDGIGLIRAVRADADLCTLPVILLSARAGTEASVEGLAAGADDYLIKPFSPDELRTRVATHITLSRQREGMAEELRHSNTQLKKALQETASARAKSEFLGILSHELRTPLNSIAISAQALAAEAANPEQDGLIHIIKAAGEELNHKLGQMLSYAALRDGHQDSQPVRFALRATLRELLAGIAAAAAAKNLELRQRLAVGLPDGWVGDAARLRQVLACLLDNAVKFTAHGRITLTARALVKSGGGSELEFSIGDTGIGIAEEHRHRLFQPFSQVDTSNTRRYGGTGMSLALSALLVQAMGGRISLDSVPGVGSNFHLTVPAEVAADQDAVQSGR